VTLSIDTTLLTATDIADQRRILARRLRASLPGPDYEASVLTDDPTFYWRLGETSGTVRQNSGGADVVEDSSGNGFTGGYATATYGAPGLLVGDSDTALSFTADGDGVGSALPLDLGLDFWQSTWELWVKTTNATMDTRLFALSPVQVSYNAATNTLSVALFDDTGTGDVEGTVTKNLHDGVPHHIVLVVTSGTTFALYVDGVSQSVTYTSQVALTTAGNAGIVVLGQDTYRGTMDEFAAYDHRLSTERVLAHYAAGTTRPFPSEDDLVNNPGTSPHTVIEDLQTLLANAKSLADNLAQTLP
jgi:hypothetical protein